MSRGPKIEDDHGGVRLAFWAVSTDAGYEQTFIDDLAAGDLSKLAAIVGEGLQFLTGHTIEVDGVAASTHEADQAREIATLRAQRKAIDGVLSENGCDCGCGHDWESHDDDCDRCLGCLISLAMEVG